MSHSAGRDEPADEWRDDLGLTSGDWDQLRFAYNYGTLEPAEGSVEEQAFLRMAAWDREETARRAHQEELDAARNRCAQQPFPGGPLTARLTSREAAELEGKLSRGYRAAEEAARNFGFQTPQDISLRNAAREIAGAYRDVHAETVIAEDAHAKARRAGREQAREPEPGFYGAPDAEARADFEAEP